MAKIKVDGVGVGWHPANIGVIPAEEFFSVEGMRKEQDSETGFRMIMTKAHGFLSCPKIEGIRGMSTMTLKVGSTTGGTFRVKIHRIEQDGLVLAEAEFTLKSLNRGYEFIQLLVTEFMNEENLCLEFQQLDSKDLRFDGFSFR